MRLHVFLLLIMVLSMMILTETQGIPRQDESRIHQPSWYADRYPPKQELEKRKACLENCRQNAANQLVVVVCQRGCDPVDWR